MAKTIVEIQSVNIDISDPQLTKVQVRVKWLGEPLMGTKGLYEKTFPARIPAWEIIKDHMVDYLLW